MKRKVKDDRSRLAAIRCLGAIGGRDEEAFQIVQQHTREPFSVDVRNVAIWGLMKYHDKASVADALLDQIAESRKRPLGKRGNVEILEDSAFRALGELGKDAKRAMPTLNAIERDDGESVSARRGAASAARQIEKAIRP